MLQDEKMSVRVETRLTQIQESFLKKTEERAQSIFDENNKMVLNKLAVAVQRVDDIVAYHVVLKKMYDDLFAKNDEAIKMHDNVQQIFKEESENFFSERLKWKTDVQS